MTDTVINATTMGDKTSVGDISTFQMALAIPEADTNGDHKVSVDELMNKIRVDLAKENTLAITIKECNQDLSYIDSFVDNLTEGAKTSVAMGLVDEVVVPDVPKFCSSVARINI